MAREGTDNDGRRPTSGDFSGADLAGQDFSGSNLAGRDFSDATLAGANLSGANLEGVDFSDADLSDANLSGSNLANADLSGADLSGVNVSGANLANAELADADLSGADLRGANLGTDAASGLGGDSLTSTVQSVVTAATLTLAFVLLAVGWPYWWIVFVVGFAAVYPLASTLAGRYEARAGEADAAETGDDERTDALDALRERYASGEIDEAEFERRVERLLETESVPDAETFYPTEDDPAEGSDRADDPVTVSDRADDPVTASDRADDPVAVSDRAADPGEDSGRTDDDHERTRERESSRS